MTTTPHPYAHILRAIADGHPVQWQDSSGKWNDQGPNGALHEISDAEYTPDRYRIAPRTITINGHDRLDGFMREQLQQSIDFDCSHPEAMPRLQRWPEWLQSEMLTAAEMAARYTTTHHEEVARVAQRNDWLQALRASLPA